MSDTIIINTNPPISETLVINTSTKAPESINVNQISYVLSVNGKIGVVILDKGDIGLGNVDNTSDLNKPISNATLSALFLKTDLGLFLSLNNFITSNSGNWDSVYFTVNELSGNWNSVYSYINQTSANEFNQQSVTTFILTNSSNIVEVNSLVNSNSSNWNIAYNSSTIYQSNSGEYATINFTNNKFLPLSGGNISGTLNVQTKLLSAGTDLFNIFLTSETDAQTLNYTPSSYILSITNGNFVNLSSINSTFNSNSSKYEQSYSFVNLQSSTILNGYNASNWVFDNSAKQISVSTVVNNNSANWNIAFDKSITFSSISGRYDNSSTSVESNSANWNIAFNIGTVYQNTSSSFATNTNLNSVSSLLTPLTLTNNLTSQLVLNTDFNSYRTSVAASTATLLPTAIYQNASGNWQGTYTNVQNNSANWNNAYNAVQAGSSNWYNASSSAFQSAKNYTHQNFLPLSGGVIEGTLSVAGNLFVTGTAAYINVQDFQVQDPLIYLGIQNPSDLLDIGLIGVYRPVGDTVEHRHTGFIRNHQDKKWILFSGLSACPLSGVGPNPDLNNPSIVIDTLKANIEGNLITDTTVLGNLTVQNNLSSNGIVYSLDGNSEQWNTAFNRSTVFSSVSSRYNSSSTVVESNSANWNNAYNTGTVYQANSASYATNTLLQSTSSLLTPITLTNILTSQLVLNTDFNNYRTSVAASTATLLPSTIYQNASGNWQSAFTNVQSNSANWNIAFNHSTIFSSVSSRYNSTSTVVESNSANWNSNYTTYNANSGNYISKNMALAFAIAL
jgi:hypothetical protein